MARVQYTFPAQGINVCRALTPPKNIEKLECWVKSIQKVFPEAPKNFTLSQSIVTVNTICLQYISNKHEKFAFVVDRRSL